MRTKKSAINMLVGLVVQIELVFLGIYSRRLFIQFLSLEYLGINSVFANVLEILTLVGCGSATVSYLTVKAMATNEPEEIRRIFKLTHYYHWITGGILLAIGIILAFFLPGILTNSTSFEWQYLQIVYILFLVDLCITNISGMGGPPGYYDCVIKASQNQAVCTTVMFVVKNLCLISQIIVLKYTADYLLYLTANIISRFTYLLVTKIYAFKQFPYLKGKIRITKAMITETRLFSEIGNNLAITISVVVFNGTDNLVIASALGITITALYSNYLQFYSQLNTLINKFLGGMSASVGNYLYGEVKIENKEILFYRIQSLCGVIGLLASGLFYALASPFVTIFYGEGLELSTIPVAIQSFLVFLSTYFIPSGMFRHPMGQYWLDRNPNFSLTIPETIQA